MDIYSSVIPGRAKREPGISVDYNLEIPGSHLRCAPE
jgi:hypothetical protein